MITTNTIVEMTFAKFFGCLILMAAIGLLAGIFVRGNSVPWRKTRYFIDNGVLRRWKFAQNKTEVCQNICEIGKRWLTSSLTLEKLLKECQEVDSLTAYRLFPHAFKK